MFVFKKLAYLFLPFFTYYQHHKTILTVLLLSMPTGFSFFDHAQSVYKAIHPESLLNDQDLFFSTNFLIQYDLVAKILIEQEHFQEISFLSTDNILLSGLYRECENAQATIIFCAGFYPGRKEGVATFIKIIPEHFNILFFDARGHGKSQGAFFSNLFNYGIDEYRDVLGALEWVSKKNDVPIIIHGICAGAYHAARALAYLKQEEDPIYSQIKGFVFDSGITSMANSCHVPVLHIRDKILPNLFLQWYTDDSKQTVKDRLLYKISWTILEQLLKPIHWYAWQRFTAKDDKLNLKYMMHHISCPILFIHAKADSYSPWEHIIQLQQQCNNYKTCIFDVSDHAVHHLKQTQHYKIELNSFFDSLFCT